MIRRAIAGVEGFEFLGHTNGLPYLEYLKRAQFGS